MVGATHLRVRPEVRGRSRKLSPAQTQRLFKRHIGLASQADGEGYMTLEEALRHVRVPLVGEARGWGDGGW